MCYCQVLLFLYLELILLIYLLSSEIVKRCHMAIMWNWWSLYPKAIDVPIVICWCANPYRLYMAKDLVENATFLLGIHVVFFIYIYIYGISLLITWFINSFNRKGMSRFWMWIFLRKSLKLHIYSLLIHRPIKQFFVASDGLV